MRAIVDSLRAAGRRPTVVMNTNAYDRSEVIASLADIVDVYLPDFKYMDPETAGRLSGAPDYPDAAMAAVTEMHRQVGDLMLDHSGIARRGLLVRHLVLPNNIAATDRVINFIANLSRDTYINIMNQYRPEYRANECFDLKRRITLEEYDVAVEHARACGLTRIDGLI
jgi:putative pyruvate formate lyase activating enzyme